MSSDTAVSGRPAYRSLNWLSANAQRMAVPSCIVALGIGLSIANPRFLTGSNITNILSGISPIAIVAVGMTLLLISGNFDLSVGGIGALCAVEGAKLLNATNLWVALLIICLLGAACGILNGLIVIRLRINSLVATLGTGYGFAGAAAVLSGSSPISLEHNTLSKAINAAPAGIPVSVIILAGVVVVAAWFSHTVIGRALFAVGVNREAARYAGLPVSFVGFLPFVITGLFSAIAGIVTIGFVNSGLATTGGDWPLQAIAGAVVGGVSISGGEGSVARAIVGMFLIGVVQNGLVITNINSNYQNIILGFVIVAAVATDVRVRTGASRAIRRSRVVSASDGGGSDAPRDQDEHRASFGGAP
jgi:ribose/xylose/arabinose/galactoside ABC-type transport system permease subunit